jgi:hypothetical protein
VIRNDGSGSVSSGYESAHDPLCPTKVGEQLSPDKCWRCDLIAKARQDERANVTAEWMSNHGDRWEIRAGIEGALADLRALRDQS